MLCASRVLDIQSSRDISDLTTAIFPDSRLLAFERYTAPNFSLKKNLEPSSLSSLLEKLINDAFHLKNSQII